MCDKPPWRILGDDADGDGGPERVEGYCLCIGVEFAEFWLKSCAGMKNESFLSRGDGGRERLLEMLYDEGSRSGSGSIDIPGSGSRRLEAIRFDRDVHRDARPARR